MSKFSLDLNGIKEFQQNREPYLMIDYVDEVIPGKSSKGYKNLTLNEWFFPKHYPDNPNYPGALQIESLAQMLTVAITTLPGNKGKETLFVSVRAEIQNAVLHVVYGSSTGISFLLEWNKKILCP